MILDFYKNIGRVFLASHFSQRPETEIILNVIFFYFIGDATTNDDSNSLDKSLDVFISYRRANGSQLASLLKVLLTIRNLSVFLDVDRLEAGKFDNNLLQSIRSARNFVLVLTPQALDRCKGDEEQKDWIHKEIGMYTLRIMP